MSEDTDDSGDAGPPDHSESGASNPSTVRHSWTESDQPSVLIVEAVAAATDRPTTELPPLQETLEANALDALLDGRPSSVTVSFRYADTDVSVTGNGGIEVDVDTDLHGDADG